MPVKADNRICAPFRVNPDIGNNRDERPERLPATLAGSKENGPGEGPGRCVSGRSGVSYLMA
jgi:hypothetical protein